MGFAGLRTVIMVVVLVVLVLAVTRLDLPGWIVPVGLVVAGLALNSTGKRASV